jgi:hypothetical protein
MKKYYGSRAFIAAIFFVGMTGLGMPWWGSLIIGLMIFAAFVFLARSGRYLVRPEGGFLPMHRDEMSTQINRRAGLNGFIVLMLFVSALLFFFSTIVHQDVPTLWLGIALISGLAAYFITDALLRRV